MFTDKLYDHKFDIDDIIAALCADDFNGKWVLDSRNNRVIAADQAHVLYGSEDGDDNNHIHIITPLPKSFLAELTRHESVSQMEPETRTELEQLLQNTRYVSELPNGFSHPVLGGWLRERVKDVALDLLDEWGLIPPSMRHVRDAAMLGAPAAPMPQATKVKVNISGDN